MPLKSRRFQTARWLAGGVAALGLAAFVVWRVTSPGDRPGAADPSLTVEPPPPSPPPPSPPPPPSAPPPPPPAAKAAAPVVTRPDEAQLMTRLRAIKDRDPAAAVELARDGKRRFPDTADAPERASILIHALGALGRASDARGEAEHMVNHYPDSAWVREIEQFTGAHRHRNIRVNDAGLIEYD